MARLTTVDCLDACDRGDVVVARPSGACRRTGARPVWFERLAGDEVTGELARWLRCGGPGVARLPDRLVGNVIQRSDPVPAGPAA